ncbi:SDR family oxidoreductase [Nocardioides sp.]|uniref:SDR family NAD(P)-dependent oxidoreductase n=1 Tax=Nocardioides sp. TaxID=35761 RepID=UPI002628F7E5|nr:SDR family oxidoreductase [Nocardioides sp.]
MDLGIADRPAVVTGGSSGIGRACVEQLLAEGARVCAVSRDVSPLDALVAAHSGRLVTASCDLTTVGGCEDAVAACVAAHGGVEILVDNAGAARGAHVLSLERERLDEALRLKLYGYLTMAQLVAPLMRERGWGRIVMVAGSAGTSPTPDNLPLSIANIGVHNLARALNDELASCGVLVNVVAPGLTLTPRADRLLDSLTESSGRSRTEELESLVAGLPAGRAAEPEEVAAAVCFLASQAASYVHASVLYLDGGARRATP